MIDLSVPRKRPIKKKIEEVPVERLPPITVRDRPPIEKVEEMVRNRPAALKWMQIQILFDMANFLEDLKDTTTAMIPKGDWLPRTYDVTTSLTVIDYKTESSLPWFGCQITNDGPNVLRVSINKESMGTKTTIELAKGEKIEIDLKVANLHLLYMESDGESHVRVHGWK